MEFVERRSGALEDLSTGAVSDSQPSSSSESSVGLLQRFRGGFEPSACSVFTCCSTDTQHVTACRTAPSRGMRAVKWLCSLASESICHRFWPSWTRSERSAVTWNYCRPVVGGVLSAHVLKFAPQQPSHWHFPHAAHDGDGCRFKCVVPGPHPPCNKC